MEFKETVDMMLSDDYKQRFKAEYHQTKTRYEKLKAFNTRIEAARLSGTDGPKHDCSEELLRNQQRVMGEYLHLLKVRAIIEKIEL